MLAQWAITCAIVHVATTGSGSHSFAAPADAGQDLERIKELIQVGSTPSGSSSDRGGALVVTEGDQVGVLTVSAGKPALRVLWNNPDKWFVTAASTCLPGTADTAPTFIVAASDRHAGASASSKPLLVGQSSDGSATLLQFQLDGRVTSLATSRTPAKGAEQRSVLFAGVTGADPLGQRKKSTAGHVVACDLTSNARLWRKSGDEGDYFGWNLLAIPDISGDGVSDLAVTAPALGRTNKEAPGFVSFLSGSDGAELRRCQAPDAPELTSRTNFGASLALIRFGSPQQEPALAVGCTGGDNYVLVLSLATGEVVRRVEASAATLVGFQFGARIVQAPDLDGDATLDFLIGDPSADWPSADVGEVLILSGRTGSQIGSIHGSKPGEGFGARIAFAESVGGPHLLVATEGTGRSLRSYELRGLSAVVTARRAADESIPR